MTSTDPSACDPAFFHLNPRIKIITEVKVTLHLNPKNKTGFSSKSFLYKAFSHHEFFSGDLGENELWRKIDPNRIKNRLHTIQEIHNFAIKQAMELKSRKRLECNDEGVLEHNFPLNFGKFAEIDAVYFEDENMPKETNLTGHRCCSLQLCTNIQNSTRKKSHFCILCKNMVHDGNCSYEHSGQFLCCYCTVQYPNVGRYFLHDFKGMGKGLVDSTMKTLGQRLLREREKEKGKKEQEEEDDEEIDVDDDEEDNIEQEEVQSDDDNENDDEENEENDDLDNDDEEHSVTTKGNKHPLKDDKPFKFALYDDDAMSATSSSEGTNPTQLGTVGQRKEPLKVSSLEYQEVQFPFLSSTKPKTKDHLLTHNKCDVDSISITSTSLLKIIFRLGKKGSVFATNTKLDIANVDNSSRHYIKQRTGLNNNEAKFKPKNMSGTGRLDTIRIGKFKNLSIGEVTADGNTYSIRMYILDYERVPQTNFFETHDLNSLIVTMNIAIQKCDSFEFFQNLDNHIKINFRLAYKTRNIGFRRKLPFRNRGDNKGNRITVGPDLAQIFYRLLFETWKSIYHTFKREQLANYADSDDDDQDAVTARGITLSSQSDDSSNEDQPYAPPVTSSQSIFPQLLVVTSSYATCEKYFPGQKHVVSNAQIHSFCALCLKNAVFVGSSIGMKNSYFGSIAADVNIAETGMETKFVKFAAQTISRTLHLNFNCGKFPDYLVSDDHFKHGECPVVYGFDIGHEIIPMKRNCSLVVNGFTAKDFINKGCSMDANTARAGEWKPTKEQEEALGKKYCTLTDNFEEYEEVLGKEEYDSPKKDFDVSDFLNGKYMDKDGYHENPVYKIVTKIGSTRPAQLVTELVRQPQKLLSKTTNGNVSPSNSESESKVSEEIVKMCSKPRSSLDDETDISSVSFHGSQEKSKDTESHCTEIFVNNVANLNVGEEDPYSDIRRKKIEKWENNIVNVNVPIVEMDLSESEMEDKVYSGSSREILSKMSSTNANTGSTSSSIQHNMQRRVQPTRIHTTVEETNRKGRKRNFEEIWNDIKDDFNDIQQVAMYPRYSTNGICGEVHFNRHFFQVNVAGPNCDRYTTNDITGNDKINTLVIKQNYVHGKNCIHGGQVYNPINVISNFPKQNEFLSKYLFQLPLVVKEILESMDFGGETIAAQERFSEIVENVNKLYQEVLGKTETLDNSSVRTELTFSFEETTNDTLKEMNFLWPEADQKDHLGESCRCFHVVDSSDIYIAQRQFYNSNVLPLVKLVDYVTQCVSDCRRYSPSLKTRLVWCAENVVRETGNKFFVGVIHQALKNTIHGCGSFFIHTLLRKHDLTERERLDFPMFDGWGLEPTVLDANYRKPLTSISRMQKDEIIHKALGRIKKSSVDYPIVYVEAQFAFRVISQRISTGKCKKDDIGYYDEIAWKDLAMMGLKNFDIYFQIMCGILIRAYHHNRLLILKEFCKEWRKPMKKDKKLTHCPVTYKDVDHKQYRNRLFFTSGADSSFKGILVTKEMKQLIKTPDELINTMFNPAELKKHGEKIYSSWERLACRKVYYEFVQYFEKIREYRKQAIDEKYEPHNCPPFELSLISDLQIRRSFTRIFLAAYYGKEGGYPEQHVNVDFQHLPIVFCTDNKSPRFGKSMFVREVSFKMDELRKPVRSFREVNTRTTSTAARNPNRQTQRVVTKGKKRKHNQIDSDSDEDGEQYSEMAEEDSDANQSQIEDNISKTTDRKAKHRSMNTNESGKLGWIVDPKTGNNPHKFLDATMKIGNRLNPTMILYLRIYLKVMADWSWEGRNFKLTSENGGDLFVRLGEFPIYQDYTFRDLFSSNVEFNDFCKNAGKKFNIQFYNKGKNVVNENNFFQAWIGSLNSKHLNRKKNEQRGGSISSMARILEQTLAHVMPDDETQEDYATLFLYSRDNPKNVHEPTGIHSCEVDVFVDDDQVKRLLNESRTKTLWNRVVEQVVDQGSCDKDFWESVFRCRIRWCSVLKKIDEDVQEGHRADYSKLSKDRFYFSVGYDYDNLLNDPDNEE